MSRPRVDAVLGRLEKGIGKTLQFFAGLSSEQWQQVVYADPYLWTVRDLLAHFVSSEGALLELAQDVATGGEGAPEGFSYDSFNAREQERLRDCSAQDLLADLAAARQVTVEWVRTLAEADLDRVGRHPALGMVSLETMLTAIYGHQLLHMRDLMRLAV
ncbi:MAG TPA: DinB family protein [Anaerolineae bacterium]|nr:DinB family protein [Anaerolineae bacterium]